MSELQMGDRVKTGFQCQNSSFLKKKKNSKAKIYETLLQVGKRLIRSHSSARFCFELSGKFKLN